MGYFANGSEGLSFEETYCQHCVNKPERQDRDCPVWSAHLLYGYDLCNSTGHPGKVMLDMLIERTPGCGNRCMMFIDKRKRAWRTVVDQDLDAERENARTKLIDWPPASPNVGHVSVPTAPTNRRP